MAAGILAAVIMWIGIIGFGFLFILAIFWLLFSFRIKRLKRKIASSNKEEIQKVRKEVEDERKLRESRKQQASQRYSRTENNSLPAERRDGGRGLFSVDFS